jgi:hypothetical protein
MSRFAFALFIIAGLLLTGYFATAAWRVTDDNQMDVTGQIGWTARK